MKILHCSESYLPSVNGVAKVVQKYAEFFSEIGYESWIATSSFESDDSYEVINNVYVKRFDLKGNDVKGIKGDIDLFVNFLKKEKFDIIVTYAAQTWHFDILKKIDKMIINNPFLITFPCGFSGLKGFRKLFYFLYFKRLPKYLDNFDLFIPHSRNYIDYNFILRYVENNKIKILPNGFDKFEFNKRYHDRNLKSFLQKLGVKYPEKKIILNVGNHMYAKNHKDFIRLARNLKKYNFINIGKKNEGIYNCSKKCLKSMNEISNFYTFELNRDDLIFLFKRSWLFVLSSNTEAFPLVILEAIASNTPFLSYNVGNVSEMPGGKIANNVKDMIENIKKCDINNEYYNKFINEIKEKKQLYEWNSILENYKKIILKYT